MRKFLLLLAFVSTFANAQYSGSYLPKAGGTIAGSLAVSGTSTTLTPSGNGIVVSGSALGGVPSVLTTGADNNVSLNIGTKGAGGVNLMSNTAVTGSLSTTADVNVSGNVNVKGTLSSTANVQPASPTNSGIALGASPSWSIASFYDQTSTANNRTAQILGINTGMTFRFVNDAGSSPVNWLIASGGAGSGITGITSNSGSGSWAHTGTLTATGNITANGNLGAGGILQAGGGVQLQTFLTSALPNCSAGDTGLTATVLDAGGTPAWHAALPAGTGTPATSTTYSVFCNGAAWVFQ